MNKKHDSLDAWGLIRASGSDTKNFLQGQLSNDIYQLNTGQPQLTSYNSPKGRVLAIIHAHRIDDAIYLQLPRVLLPAIMQRLKMFVLRSKVTLEDASDEMAKLGIVGMSRKQRIAAGIPTIYPDTQDMFVAQMLNLDTLDAINFKKGCYTGQEVIARLHYLGKSKRRMYPVSANNTDFSPGQPIYGSDGKQGIGNIVDGVGEQALAVLQTGKADQMLYLNSPDGPQLSIETISN